MNCCNIKYVAFSHCFSGFSFSHILFNRCHVLEFELSPWRLSRMVGKPLGETCLDFAHVSWLHKVKDAVKQRVIKTLLVSKDSAWTRKTRWFWNILWMTPKVMENICPSAAGTHALHISLPAVQNATSSAFLFWMWHQHVYMSTVVLLIEFRFMPCTFSDDLYLFCLFSRVVLLPLQEHPMPEALDLHTYLLKTGLPATGEASIQHGGPVSRWDLENNNFM